MKHDIWYKVQKILMIDVALHASHFPSPFWLQMLDITEIFGTAYHKQYFYNIKFFSGQNIEIKILSVVL